MKIAVLLFMGVALLVAGIYSLVTGRLAGKGGSIYREKSPIVWALGSIVYIALSVLTFALLLNGSFNFLGSVSW